MILRVADPAEVSSLLHTNGMQLAGAAELGIVSSDQERQEQTMQEMSRKNKLFTDSVIRRMTRVSLACGAINLAQGAITDLPRSAHSARTSTPSRWARRTSGRRWRVRLVLTRPRKTDMVVTRLDRGQSTRSFRRTPHQYPITMSRVPLVPFNFRLHWPREGHSDLQPIEPVRQGLHL